MAKKTTKRKRTFREELDMDIKEKMLTFALEVGANSNHPKIIAMKKFLKEG